MSVFYNALVAVKTELLTLSLSGLDSSRIKVRRVPHDGEHYFPGITVHPVQEMYQPGTNMREDIGYGCAVTMVQNNDNDDLYLLDRLLSWRETIRRYFVENDTIGSETTVYTVKVEHGPVILVDELFDKNYDISGMVIRVWSRESRT